MAKSIEVPLWLLEVGIGIPLYLCLIVCGGCILVLLWKLIKRQPLTITFMVFIISGAFALGLWAIAMAIRGTVIAAYQ